ncbi:Unconventional myosin-XV [Saguinus oedipus]|uniref:Unconventional myosin-XV n=1 Tax=Saguinus oedipus TaxID=9490 RepID=A0ABQ9VN91_SAGOE|nr:Unconventional myosin-XV [Saguinus oedipus]
MTRVFLGRHHDPGPGQLTKSAGPSPEKPKEETTLGDPQLLAEIKHPTPTPPKDAPGNPALIQSG